MKVLIRTKGNFIQGMGDVYTSISLYEEFLKNNVNVFSLINNDKETIELLNKLNINYEFFFNKDYETDILIFNQLNTPILELENFKYKFLVTIDDTGKIFKKADLKFNILYNKGLTDCVIDYKYIMLRKQFNKLWKKNKIINKKVKNILVMQGGSDTHNIMPKILNYISKIDNLKDINFKIIIGPAFKNIDEIKKYKQENFEFINNVADLSKLMYNADLAITAGGISLFELACVGTPCLIVCAEEFEQETVDRFEKDGFGINLGFGKNLIKKNFEKHFINLIYNYNFKKNMSKNGKKLVDGNGSKYTVDKILKEYKKVFYVGINDNNTYR